MRVQQRAFDQFRKIYNEERPHEALGGDCPSDVYIAAQAAFPDRLARMEYEFDCDVVRLDKHGKAKWGRRTIHISPALAHEDVCFEPIDESCWEIYFGTVLLGYFNHNRPTKDLIRPCRQWKKCQP